MVFQKSEAKRDKLEAIPYGEIFYSPEHDNYFMLAQKDWGKSDEMLGIRIKDGYPEIFHDSDEIEFVKYKLTIE